jgi:hypothetical protein
MKEWIDVTILYSKSRFTRFKYYHFGHQCGIKPKYGDNRLFKCDCLVNFIRIVSYWYTPVYKIAQKIENIILKKNRFPTGMIGKFYRFSTHTLTNRY